MRNFSHKRISTGECKILQSRKSRHTREAFEADIAEKTLLKRLPKLTEVASVMALMASDYASAVTGTVADVTCGETLG